MITETQAALLKMKESLEKPLFARLATAEKERDEALSLNGYLVARVAELEIRLAEDVKTQERYSNG